MREFKFRKWVPTFLLVLLLTMSAMNSQAQSFLYSWGANNNGQLGNGNYNSSSSPVQVSGLTNITMLATSGAGGGYALALRKDGTVWAWGYNNYGELGNNTYNNSSSPVQVLGVGGSGLLNGIIALAVSEDNASYALGSNGMVYAWGRNDYGQLGHAPGTDGDTTQDYANGYFNTTPRLVLNPDYSLLSNVTQIVAGDDHVAALQSNGTVWSWGYNADGELGNGGTMQSSYAVQALGLGKVATLVAGQYYTLALTSETYHLAFDNAQTGQVVEWTMGNYTISSTSTIQSGIPSVWKLVGSGNFYGDGNNDLLWQNTSTGEIDYWQMNGTTYVKSVQVAAPGSVPPSTGWNVVGAGNFNGSAQPNILFQNAKTGEIGYWTLASSKYSGYTQIVGPGVVSTAWHIAATPDVDGSGQSDIVLQNMTTGEIGFWKMTNGMYEGYTQISAPGAVSTAWRLSTAF